MDKLLAIKRGDQRIFAEVFEMFYQKTFGFFMIRTHKNREESKELTQLTYIKLWQTRHTLSEEHSLEKQLFIIAKYTLIDFICKESTSQKVKEKTIESTALHACIDWIIFPETGRIINIYILFLILNCRLIQNWDKIRAGNKAY